MGVFGTHGIISLVTYILPGIAVDIVLLFSKNNNYNIIHLFLGGVAANTSGTFLSNIVFFRLPFIPLILTMASGELSGGLRGLILYNIIEQFKKFNILSFDTQEGDKL